MATKLQIAKSPSVGEGDTGDEKKAAAQCLKRLGVLIAYLRQSKQISIGMEDLTRLRKAFPSLPREEELEYATFEAFTEKLALYSPDNEKLTPSAIQRWEAGVTLPSILNIFPVAKVAGVTVQELYEYLLEGYITASSCKLVSDIESFLHFLRIEDDINTLAEVIRSSAERISELERKTEKNESSESLILTPGQCERLAQVLAGSLVLRPSEILPPDLQKAILKASPAIEYHAQSLALVASVCCKIEKWGKKGNPVLDPDETYEDFRELLIMLD